MPKITLTDKDIEQIAKKVMNEVTSAQDFLTKERERVLAYRVFDALASFQTALRSTSMNEEHYAALKKVLEGEIEYVNRYLNLPKN